MLLATRLFRWSGLLVLTAGIWFFTSVTAAPVATDPDRQDLPAEKIRKALEQNISVSLNQTLEQAVAQLREQLKINLVFDNNTVSRFTVTVPVDGNPGAYHSILVKHAPVALKVENVKGRQALRSLFGPFGLDFAIVDGTLMISTPEMATERQLRQRVSIDLNQVPLNSALKQLARETGSNLVVDPYSKDVEPAVTLTLADVPLDTVVRLLAETAGLKTVRIDNVLFVTTDERALRLQSLAGQQGRMSGGMPAVGGLNMAPAAPMPLGGFERGGFGKVSKKKAVDIK